jgi:hypothetical protein
MRRARWRRLLTWALRIVALLLVAYLIAANVLLRTRLLRNAVSGPSSNFAISGSSSALRLDYDSAYSIIPGRVHVEGLSLRGRERTVEWFLTLDHADVAISLGDLLRRTFHATRLRSSGFAIRARMRLERADATPDVVSALPPIPGFADPPLLSDEPQAPALTDATYKLWTVDLEDVEVEHVREVWIHTVRSEGDTRVRGRWLFHPQRWLDVGPATVDENGVDVSYGSRALASGLRGSFGATVHPFDLRQANGLEVLDHISYDGQLHGRLFIADVLRLLAPRSSVRFTRWEGPFDTHVILDHGRLADGTRMQSEAPDGEIETDGLSFQAPIRTDVGIDGGLATIDIHVPGLRVSHLGVEQAHATSIAAAVTSRHLQLSHGFDDALFTVDIGGAGTRNLGAWVHYLPSTSAFVVQSGIVTADGHASGSLAEGSASGAATVTAEDLRAKLGSAELSATLVANVDLQRGTWADRTFDLSGSHVVLRAISARSAHGGEAFLVIPAVTVVAPRLALAPSGVDGHASIDLPRAELVDLGGLGALLPLPRGFVLEAGRGHARLRADAELASRAVRGDGEIVARGVRVRAGSTELFGDLDCAVRARRTEGAGGSTDLSGSTLALTQGGTGSAARPEDAWWGNVVLREATLRTGGGVHFDANVHATAKDASPATALVAENTSVPTWAANIFRMPILDADAELRGSPSSFEVHSLVARGAGGTSVHAEYVKRDGRQDGAVLMDLGWIDLGYDLAEGAAGLVLLGPEAWYQRKTAILRGVAGAAGRKAEAANRLARYAAMSPQARKDEARTLAADCGLDVRSCDGASIESLLGTASAAERESLGGIAYAPLVVLAAKGGTDGVTLDPRVVGSVAEALRLGGAATLDDIPSVTAAEAREPGSSRGKVIAVTGRVSTVRSEGPYWAGALATETDPVYYVTPFAPRAVPGILARFRGVFVQRYAPADAPEGQSPSIVLVGAFVQ